MSSWNYAVSAQKPTSVIHAVVGRFTAPDQLNLIVSKCTHIEVHLVADEGLQLMLDVPLYGRVASMELWKPANHEQDMLFISTERYQFCILAYDAEAKEIVTKAKGDVSDRTGRPADVGQIGIVDPLHRVIGLHLYDGLFKVIPATPAGQLRTEAFNIRLEELQVLDIVFLYRYPRPTIALLYKDSKDFRHLKTYELQLQQKDLSEGPWSQSNLESGASALIALPFGGLLVVGEQTITYHSGSSFKTINVDFALFKAFGKVDADGTRWLLGDHQGWLRILVLTLNERKDVLSLSIEKLGRTSQASCICYLDNATVFLGSCFGDSMLLRLGTEPDETGSFITELERMQNLGPITDFVVIDLDRHGQGQVITCSGAFRDGSLRVVRNRIGIDEQARVDLPGIKGMWSLLGVNAEQPMLLVLSFMSETRVLAMQEDDEIGEVELPGFEMESPTVVCAKLAGGAAIAQATPRALRLVDGQTLQLLDTWEPPFGVSISMACASANHLLLATSGKGLRLFTTREGRWVQLAEREMSHEVACVALREVPTHPNAMDTSDAGEEAPLYAAIGMWTSLTVQLLAVPSLDTLCTEMLGSDVIPRSLLFYRAEAKEPSESTQYLLCALGDGQLMSFVLKTPASDATHSEAPTLSDRKKVALGTQPISLVPFWVGNTQNVFACSDRPAVVHSGNGTLLYSSVNLEVAAHVTPFFSEAMPDWLAIAAEDALIIGTIDEVRKLHIRSVPLGEQPRRLCHLEEVRTFAVLTTAIESAPSGEEVERHFVRLLDDQTFDRLAEFELLPQEAACSVLPISFEGTGANFLVVGTALVIPEEPEPTTGRLLVFETQERGQGLELRSEFRTKGAVYALEEFRGKLLAGVNNKLQLFTWSATSAGVSHGLVLRHEHCGHILALYVQSRGDFILVGDLMKSLALLQYSASTGELTELARDYNANWMTAVAFLDDDTFLGAENGFNLIVARKNSEAATDEERQRLDIVGEYHLGEFVNRFRRGSLTMQFVEGGAKPLPTLLYGTVNGVLGVLVSLPQQQYSFLSKVQANLTKVIKGVGGLSHREYRSFCNERKTVEASGFIDGDLLEGYLELSGEKKAEVVQGLDVSVEELTRQVEELARLH